MRIVAIRAVNLGKKYEVLPRLNRMDLRDRFASLFPGGQPKSPTARRLSQYYPAESSRDSESWALRHVSFEIERGSIVGVLGDNGCGKTTLLKILARISHPTEGYAELRGRTGALLAGLAGFHAELTGRDNIFLLGTLLGLTRDENTRQFHSIAAFAELEAFLDIPLKFYSSGMCVRLAFAVAAHADSDVLLVDEVLAVADRTFQDKSLRKMTALARAKRTVMFVSHDLALVGQLCTHGIVFSGDRIVRFGSAHDGIQLYRSIQRNAALQNA